MEDNNQNGVAVQGTVAQGRMNVTAESAAAVQELANTLEDMDELMEITSDYLKFEKDDKLRFVYAGMTEISSVDGKSMSEAVKLMDSDGKFKISAAMVLVGTCKTLNAPCAIQVECLGKVKGKKGEYDDLKITALGSK